MRFILKKTLKILAILTIKRYKPRVVVVAGSVGKTSAKDAIYLVLSDFFNVRRSVKSFNNEMGVPITILGISSYGRNIFLWILAFFVSILKLIWCRYPEILILEFGADKPGDYDYLLSIARPDITVMTAIPEVPPHVEMYPKLKDLLLEKSKVLKILSRNDFAVINSDYKNSFDMIKKTKANILTYGFSGNSDLKIYESDFIDFSGGVGTSFKVGYKGSTVPVRIKALGKPSVYAASVAVSVGLLFKINLVGISEKLSNYKSPKGRLNMFKGIKNTLILDDSYNASPESVKASLDIFRSIKKERRKVAVLGSILEIGEYSKKEHESIGGVAGSFCDVVVTVGEDARFIAEKLKKASFVEGDNLFIFDDSLALANEIKNIVNQDDFILFKASQGIRLEFAIKELLPDKDKAYDFLVRQEKEWL